MKRALCAGAHYAHYSKGEHVCGWTCFSMFNDVSSVLHAHAWRLGHLLLPASLAAEQGLSAETENLGVITNQGRLLPERPS
jgi:hypothetical protein